MRSFLVVASMLMMGIAGFLHVSTSSSQPLAGPSSPNPDFAAVRQAIEEQVATNKIPSLSIAVSRNGKILWEQSFGLADEQKHVPATIHTPYFLASVAKSFTATSLLMLRDHGQINLDDPVNEYLGEAKLSSPMWDVSQATIRRLMTHTAGLTTYARFCYSDEPNCRINETQTIRRYGIVFWPPGDHFDYSNLDYGILGDVVAHISGEGLNEFYENRIFRPLGMMDCFLPVSKLPDRPSAVGYAAGRGRTTGFLSATPGGSGLYCSVDSLIRFGMFALKEHAAGRRPILSDASVDVMESKVISLAESQGYGLGWWTNDDLYGYRGVLAQGGTDIAQAWLQLVPSEGIAVAALSNTGSADVQRIINGTLAVLLPRFAKRLECTAGQQPSAHTNPPSYLFPGEWKGFIHTYKGNLPLTLNIGETGAVSSTVTGQRPGQMTSIRYRESRLIGQMPGNLNTTEDTGPYPYDLYVELYLRGDELTGTVTTTAKPDAKYSNELSYWVELRRE
ncbi:MAG TPA: serine hydrolase domain-containing protein [Steroidobacteraceae bacterium]|nr:serine hydrolase domain-containing protein [Steroidobacteraceae bacterium]